MIDIEERLKAFNPIIYDHVDSESGLDHRDKKRKFYGFITKNLLTFDFYVVDFSLESAVGTFLAKLITEGEEKEKYILNSEEILTEFGLENLYYIRYSHNTFIVGLCEEYDNEITLIARASDVVSVTSKIHNKPINSI